jgi:hypothetical protein
MAIMKIHESLLYARNAGADLSEKLNYFAKVDSDGDIVVAGDGQAVLGTLIESAIENKPVTVQFGGIGKVIAAESITAGAIIASDTNGQAVAAAAGDFVVGIALTGASANELVPFAFIPGRRHA